MADDLAARLLAAGPTDWPEIVQQASPSELEEAVARLGRVRDPSAAAALTAIDALATQRSLRKAARRELHRLRAVGVEAPRVDLPPAPAETVPTAQVRQVESWATSFDSTGTRALWLLGDRPLGGAWLAAAVANDLDGLLDVDLLDTTRKKALRDLDKRREGAELTWVELPSEYALLLVREALDLARSRGRAVPRLYARVRALFGEAERGPERPLVYESVSMLDVRFLPDLVPSAGALLLEPELRGWHLEPTEALRAEALDVARSASSRLLVPGKLPVEQMQRLLVDAAETLLTSDVRRALKRRFEETGYVFVKTERMLQARQAVAVAQALVDEAISVERLPLVGELILAGLAGSLAGVDVGGRPASQVLMEVSDQLAEAILEASGPSGPSAPGSGLILPR